MLYPIATDSRLVMDLSGVWKFMIEDEQQKVDVNQPLPTRELMAVPASFNDQAVLAEIRQHSGFVWYEKDFTIATALHDERIVLRFGSATHEAWVYVNGKFAVHHKGGFTPFEVEINEFLVTGTNRLTVRISNLLDYTTLPVGNYSEHTDENGKLKRKVDENFDFFNYAGLHRPVKIYTTPKHYIEDIVIVPDVDLAKQEANVQVSVKASGQFDEVKVTIVDESDEVVAEASGSDVQVKIQNVQLWQPLQAYLYTARVEGYQDGKLVDVYNEPFGVRKIEVKNGKFLLNGESFYFKGFGKHEDTYIRGRGLDEAYNVHDIKLMKKNGCKLTPYVALSIF